MISWTTATFLDGTGIGVLIAVRTRGWQRVPAGDHPSQPFLREVLELTGVIPLPTATIDQTSVPDADRYPARTTSGPPAR